ncbi:MAG: bifunctional UDP-3-O-[3-hydroxymyristoyl] N-acetylglucosamine deacetylase/3-hydroxyacyl-ACP dehydratase [Bacteroidales bacterium]
MEYQKTLSNSFSLKGKGLHTGQDVTMTVKPASVDHGFKFVRVDAKEPITIDADANLVVQTERGTILEKDGFSISTIEHILAALVGMDIDNALIELDGEEVPILDGSAKYFVEAIEKAGIDEQTAEREYLVIKEKIVYEDAARGTQIIALPDREYSLDVHVTYNAVLKNQFAALDSMSQFKERISECRTFVFLSELEMLLNNDLIKGGQLDNAIVIVDKEHTQEEFDRLAAIFNHDKVEVKADGILNNVELKYPNECARHKLLDMLGDLALCGKRIKGRIIATKPGHQPNTEFAKLLKKEIRRKRNAAPDIDLNAEPLMDVNQIKKLLPHRYPFLLVDKIVYKSETSIVGVKNVTSNENFFQGHFPEEPIMPGVLLVEAMAQTGGVLMIGGMGEGEFSTYFAKIDNIKFRKKVVPGDTVVMKLILTSPMTRGMAYMKGQCFVGDTLVAEGEFMAQIIKTQNK